MNLSFLKKSLTICLVLFFNQAKSEIPDAEFRQFFYSLSERLKIIETKLDYVVSKSQQYVAQQSRSVFSCDDSFHDCSLLSGISASAKASGKASLGNTGDLSASAIRSSSIRPSKTIPMGSPTSPLIRRSPSPQKTIHSPYRRSISTSPSGSGLRKRPSSDSSIDSLSFSEILSD